MAWYRDYRCKNWTMFKDYENNIQYGIDESKNWYSGEIVNKKANSEYLASEEEIEKALRKEAKRRGFVEGVKFLGCHGAQKDEELSLDFIKFSKKDYFDHNGLYNKNSWIFYKGKWGEVVEYNSSAKTYYNKEGLEITTNPVEEEFNILGEIFNLAYGALETKATQDVVGKLYFYHKSEKHGVNFYEVLKEIQTKVGEDWKTFVIYKQLGSDLEFSREKEEFYSKFKQVYV